MKPVTVRITKTEAFIIFDDGSEHKVATLEAGENEMVMGYIIGLLDLKDVSDKRGVYTGTIGVDMELADWNTAANHWQYAARKNDALFYQEIDGAFPEEYLANLRAQFKFVNGAHGVFEGLVYGN